jgi:hypothetical protein
MKTDNQRKKKNTHIIGKDFFFFPMKFVGMGISSFKYRFIYYFFFF